MSAIQIEDKGIKSRVTPAELGLTPPVRSQEKVDPLLLAYLYLVDAATSQNHTAMLKAKQLENSSGTQEQISREMDNIRWFDIPEAKYSDIVHHGGGNPFSSFSVFIAWICNGAKLESYTTGGSLLNRGDIDIAVIENQQSESNQQLLQQKLALAQQQGEMKDTEISTSANIDMGTIQQCTGILDLIKAVQDKVLLRQKSRLEQMDS